MCIMCDLSVAAGGPSYPDLDVAFQGVSAVGPEPNSARANNLFRFSDGWDNTNLTYSFASGAKPLQKEIRSIIVDIFDEIESFTGLKFSRAEGVGDISIGQNHQSGTNAYAYYPSKQGRYDNGGDVWLNVDGRELNDPRFDTYYNMVLRHEILHSLGLSHSFEVGLYGDEDSYKYTLTAYLRTNTYKNENGRDYYPASYMPYDIAALQELYGANEEYNDGATFYRLDANVIQTIWDSGGSDTIDARHLDLAVRLDLRPGAYSTAADAGYEDNFAISYGTWIENAIGGDRGDTISGNRKDNMISGQGGRDRINGEGGSDEIYGDGGADRINGGNGSDNLHGGIGGDLIRGGSGGDRLYGGNGGDKMKGSFGRDKIYGGDGGDKLLGGGGSDRIFGGTGRDDLRGGAGNDVINGGKGNDRLVGGEGSDTFLFRFGCDRILDLEVEDRIQIHSNLLPSGQSVDDLIRYADGSLILDFGRHELILEGVHSLEDLRHLEFI